MGPGGAPPRAQKALVGGNSVNSYSETATAHAVGLFPHIFCLLLAIWTFLEPFGAILAVFNFRGDFPTNPLWFVSPIPGDMEDQVNATVSLVVIDRF